jgi:hypothetical protein
VAYLGGTALAPLLAAIDGERTLKEVAARWASVVSPRRAVELLVWMWGNGLITAAGGSASS